MASSFVLAPFLFLFVVLLLGGILSLVFAFREKRSRALPLALFALIVLIMAGVLAPELFNLPPTPFAVYPALSFAATTPQSESSTTITVAATASLPVSTAVPLVVSGGSGTIVSVEDSNTHARVAGVPVTYEVDNKVIATDITSPAGETGPLPVSPDNYKTSTNLKVSAFLDGQVEKRMVQIGVGRPANVILAFNLLPEVPAPNSKILNDVALISIDQATYQTAPAEVQIQPQPPSAFSPPGEVGSAESTNNNLPIRFYETSQPFECPSKLEFSRKFFNSELTLNNGELVSVATITLTLKNTGCKGTGSVMVEEHIPSSIAPDVTYLVGTDRKVKAIKPGSVILDILFQGISPGQSASTSYTVKGQVDDNILKDFKSPVVVAQPEGSSGGSFASKQGLDKSVLALVFALVILGSVIALVLRRK